MFSGSFSIPDSAAHHLSISDNQKEASMQHIKFNRSLWATGLFAAIGVCTIVLVFKVFLGAGAFLEIETAEPSDSDLIVILGGGGSERLALGEELLSRNYSSRVFLTGLSPLSDPGNSPLNPRNASPLRIGIAKDRIYLDNTSKNTWQDVNHIRNLLQSKGWRTVLIITDPPHLRRVAWVCERVLSKASIDYTLVPTHPSWWDRDHWWRNHNSRWFVITEYIKLLGYQLLYF